MNEDIENVLDSMNADYGGDLTDYLGGDWRNIVRRYLESAWNYGYTTGIRDNSKF